MRSLLTPDEADTPRPASVGSVTPLRRPRRRRRRRRALIAALVLIALVAGVGGGSAFAYETLKAKAANLQADLTGHLQAGQADLEAAKASLKQANTNHDVTLVTKAKTQFTDARGEFLQTRQIADGSQLLRQVERLPDVGPQALSRHHAVDGVADMGVAISDAGLDLSALAAGIIAPPKGSEAGRTLLTVLDQASASLVKVRSDLQRAEKAAAGVDLSVVPVGQQATFVKAKSTIKDALAGMDEFQQFVPIMKEILGANGARTYLVEQVNPAELRPGGGFIGTYSILRADQGTLKLLQSGNAYNLTDPRPVVGQKGYVTPPGPIASLIGTTSWSFVDSNFYPDFPSNALAAEQFVQPRIGGTINAVISIDYFAVAKLLDVTGPLTIPGYGATVDSNNFIATVIKSDLGATDATHKAILSAIAGPLMQRVSTLPPERWPALLSVLNGLATTHSLQVYFNNPTVEGQVQKFGWAGTLNPAQSSDYFAEVEANVGATKANYFTVRHYSITLSRDGNVLHHYITVQLLNNMPYVYRPQDYYKAYIRLLLPPGATETWGDLKGSRFSNPNPPPGLQQLSGWITIPGYGNRGAVFFEYNTPWVTSRQGEHTTYWQKQPGTGPDQVDVTWNDGQGKSYTAHGSLTQDMTLTLSSRGVIFAAATAASAQLPSLSLG